MAIDDPFIGSEALTGGLVRKHELRSKYRALFPDIYMPRGAVPTLRQRAEAAWLWGHRNGVIAGLTAAGLHGAKWVDDALPVEMVWSNARPPAGLRTCDMRLDDDEFDTLVGLPVTTPERTAFDIGRRGRIGAAVAHLDALASATGVKADDVLELARRHRGVRAFVSLRRRSSCPTLAPSRQRKPGYACWSSRPDIPDRALRYPSWAPTAGLSTTSTWVGSRSSWLWSTTGTNTAPTESSSPTTSAASKNLPSWDGRSSGSPPTAGPPM